MKKLTCSQPVMRQSKVENRVLSIAIGELRLRQPYADGSTCAAFPDQEEKWSDWCIEPDPCSRLAASLLTTSIRADSSAFAIQHQDCLPRADEVFAKR
jgi:hypothetical protein